MAAMAAISARSKETRWTQVTAAAAIAPGDFESALGFCPTRASAQLEGGKMSLILWGDAAPSLSCGILEQVLGFFYPSCRTDLLALVCISGTLIVVRLLFSLSSSSLLWADAI